LPNPIMKFGAISVWTEGQNRDFFFLLCIWISVDVDILSFTQCKVLKLTCEINKQLIYCK